MRRSIGTVVTVAGLLAVGSAAAAINVAVLRTAAIEPTRLVTETRGDMTVLQAVPGAAPSATTSASATPEPVTTASATAEATAPATPSVEPASEPSASEPAVQPLPKERRRGAESKGPQGEDRRLSTDQMDLLRVAAMAHVRPDVVLAAARGEANVDSTTLQTIRSVAEYIGVDLERLADVQDVPRMRERKHGGTDEHGERNDDY